MVYEHLLSVKAVMKLHGMLIHDYFDAVNEKNYDKAFTYVINQTKTNPVEKQKWMESMKSAPKVVVGSLGASRSQLV